MKKGVFENISILLVIMPFVLNGQGLKELAVETSVNSEYYRIDNAYYIEGDSSTVLKNWTDKMMEMIFKSSGDSLVISVSIGSRDKVFFAGMAVKIENPGFVTSGTVTEFYHWMFVSHIKEGIRNAYILKEYVDGSLEKLGKKHFFINIAFPDQTEFQFYGYQLNSDSSDPLK